MPGDLDKDDQKSVLKEALKEWLEEKYVQVGKWTIRGMVCMILYLIVRAYVTTHIALFS